MNRHLLEILRCPACGDRLTEVPSRATPATLICGAGHEFEIRDGIPRFVDQVSDPGQAQAAESFGFKWQQLWGHGGETRDFYQKWFLHRFGFSTMAELGGFLSTRTSVLDAGTGNGQSASWYVPLIGGNWVGVDISKSVDVARREMPCSESRDLVQADILRLPFGDAVFDTVLSDGVLHHTPSTRDALASVARVLKSGGIILFYVYRRKGPVREFSDDHVRNVVAKLPPESAWEALKPLTKLGRSLAQLGATVHVPDDIPYLGIVAGDYDLQRFVYDYVMKVFWNDRLSFDENHHVNFDWYHPQYAHRQTEDDVARWCQELNLSIEHQLVEVSGISVKAVKR